MSNHDQAVAVVTGPDSGIGLAIAQKFVDSGYRVVGSGVRLQAGKKSAREIQLSGDAVTYVKADVREESEGSEISFALRSQSGTGWMFSVT
jgi:NADP-dependent 3-hydroxy acid dehydrogenase YdfG